MYHQYSPGTVVAAIVQMHKNNKTFNINFQKPNYNKECF